MAFITADNAVYTAGYDKDNRLGISTSSSNELPRRLSFDNPSIQVESVSCGNNHSVAITKEG